MFSSPPRAKSRSNSKKGSSLKKNTSSSTPHESSSKDCSNKPAVKGILRRKSTVLGEYDQTLTDMGETFKLKKVTTASKETAPMKKVYEPKLTQQTLSEVEREFIRKRS